MKANMRNTKNYCWMQATQKYKKNLKKLRKWLKKFIMIKKFRTKILKSEIKL